VDAVVGEPEGAQRGEPRHGGRRQHRQPVAVEVQPTQAPEPVERRRGRVC